MSYSQSIRSIQFIGSSISCRPEYWDININIMNNGKKADDLMILVENDQHTQCKNNHRRIKWKITTAYLVIEDVWSHKDITENKTNAVDWLSRFKLFGCYIFAKEL